jgi:hypothetical protein
MLDSLVLLVQVVAAEKRGPGSGRATAGRSGAEARPANVAARPRGCAEYVATRSCRQTGQCQLHALYVYGGGRELPPSLFPMLTYSESTSLH